MQKIFNLAKVFFDFLLLLSTFYVFEFDIEIIYFSIFIDIKKIVLYLH